MMRRRDSLAFLLVCVFWTAQGWQKSLFPLRSSVSCISSRNNWKVNPFSKIPQFLKTSPDFALFASGNPRDTPRKLSFFKLISSTLGKLQYVLNAVVRKVISLVMITAVALSMLFAISSPSVARERPAQYQVQMIAAKPTTRSTTSRQRELLSKAKSQKRKLQQSKQQKQQQQTQKPQKIVDKPDAKVSSQSKSSSESKEKAATPISVAAPSSQSISAKELYDKIGVAAVIVSLLSIFVRFKSNAGEVKSLLSELKQKPNPDRQKSVTRERAAIPSIPSSQKVMKKVSSRSEDVREEMEEEDDGDDEHDDSYIDREKQKTLSVKDYLQQKSPTSSRGSSSSPASRRGNIRETKDTQSPQSLAASTQKTSSSTPSKPVREEDIEDIPLPFATVIAAPEESIIPESMKSEISTIATKEKAIEASKVLRGSSAPTATQSSPPVAKKKSKNFISRLFSKPGGGRPSDLAGALLRDKEGTTSLRMMIGTGLLQFVPEDLGRRIGKDFPAILANFPPNSNEEVLSAIESLREEGELSPVDTAEVFAEVTNAFVVKLVDRAAESLEDLQSQRKGSSMESGASRSVVVQRLDDLTNFMAGVTPLFLAVVQNHHSAIEPLQYNGKTARGKLEQLFEEYLRDLQSIDPQQMMSSMDTDSQGEGQRLLEDRNDRLAKIQYLLAIKENKRNSIEQKIMREQMSKMFGQGQGEKGGLGDLFSGFKGAMGGSQGGFPGINQKEMEDLMKEMQSNPEKLEEAMKAMKDFDPKQMNLPEGMPDLSKLKPEEVNDMIQQQVSWLQERMKSGEITLSEIQEVEQSLGTSLEGFLSTVNSKEVREMTRAGGLPLSNVIETFEELAAIKKQLQS